MSVTAAQGFRAAGIAAGIKDTGAKDLALIVNDGPDKALAAVFTSNRVKAAPVIWSMGALTASGRQADAVVLNSGGANACTGQPGFEDAQATAAKVAEVLNTTAERVQIGSTGLIGERLPMDALLAGVDTAAQNLDAEGSAQAAEAIMTTDTRSKSAVASKTDGTYQVGGIAKGAGMIAPGMATMLAVITTDAVVDADVLQQVVTEAVRTSFNRADSDGCMSTNDTVWLLSSGASGIRPDLDEFTEAVREVCASLARQIIADAEGASHDIAVTVKNAETEAGAEAVARAITRSNLFKTAIFGRDPNWGRVLSAAGTVPESVAAFDANAIDVTINGVTVCRAGGIGEDRELVDLSPREVTVEVNLNTTGSESATIWTNDLTYEYVEVNAEYSS